MYACTGSSKKSEPLSSTDTKQIEKENNQILYPSGSDTIRMDIVNGKASLQIHKKEQQSINVIFNSPDYTKLTGTLSSRDSIANIRFSTISLPTGNTDGPFGRDITYNLPVKGDYILSIHENQMAGDPWAGDFEVTISLSK